MKLSQRSGIVSVAYLMTFLSPAEFSQVFCRTKVAFLNDRGFILSINGMEGLALCCPEGVEFDVRGGGEYSQALMEMLQNDPSQASYVVTIVCFPLFC